LIEKLLARFGECDYEYAALAIGGSAASMGVNGYPDGLDAECCAFDALERSWREATEQPDREHVTQYVQRKGLFRCGLLVPDHDYSALRLTVDEPEDLELARRLFEELYVEADHPFSFEDVLRVLSERPDLVGLNRQFVGKEKYRDLWEARAGHPEHHMEES
ncbi:MAG: hypothetical protein WCN81_13805, partial [Actinomycetes bacterium]